MRLQPVNLGDCLSCGHSLENHDSAINWVAYCTICEKDCDLRHQDDLVNHPEHYTSHPSGVECITITEHCTFNIGNAIKYLWRNGLKPEASATQDLRKAIWYIEREIQRLSAEGGL